MDLKVLTTVGTSSLTNYKKYADEDTKKEINRLLELPLYFEGKSENDTLQKEKKTIEKILAAALAWAREQKDVTSISAEIKTLLKIKEKYNKDIETKLLSSDTVGGKIAANIVAELLFDNNIASYQKTIKGLQVKNAKQFLDEGLYNLVHECKEYAENCFLDNVDVVYNFSGGFKGTIPYITIIAQLLNVPLFYIFEYTDELIEIARVPLNFDFGFFARHIDIIRKLETGIQENEWDKLKKENGNLEYQLGYFRACYSIQKGEVTLNALGRIMLEHFNGKLEIKCHRLGSYFKDDPKTKKALENVFKQIYTRIMHHAAEGTAFDKIIGDDKLYHDKQGKNTRVARYSVADNTQLRILYKVGYYNENDIDSFYIILYDYIEKRRESDGKYTEDGAWLVLDKTDNPEDFKTITIDV